MMNIGRRLSDLERALGDDARCPRCTPRSGMLDTRDIMSTCSSCGRAIDSAGRSWRGATLIVVSDDGELPEAVRRCCAGAVKLIHGDDEALLGPTCGAGVAKIVHAKEWDAT